MNQRTAAAKTTDRLDSAPMREVTYEPMSITPKRAEAMLAKNFDNRNLRPLKVAALARDMREGNWRDTGEAIKFDWNGRLIDGQHRLHAVVESGRAIRVLVIKGLDPESQVVVDSGAKRTAADALKFAGESSNQNVIAAAVRIIVGYQTGTTRTSNGRLPDLTHSEIVAFYRTREEDLAAAALSARRVTKTTGASVSTVCAFAYITSQVDPEASFRFLSDVENMRTTGKGDPIFTLTMRIRNIRDREEKTSQAQQLYYFLRAWNAWRAGKSLHGMKDSTQAGAALLPEAS